MSFVLFTLILSANVNSALTVSAASLLRNEALLTPSNVSASKPEPEPSTVLIAVIVLVLSMFH